MAQCKWCDKKGLFLSVTKDGVCKTCSFIIIQEVQSRYRVISESREIIEKSSNPATISGRFQIIINNLNSLLKYEDKGIEVFNLPILEFINDASHDNNEMMIALFYDEYIHNKHKIITYKTENAKLKASDKFLSKANEFKALLIEDKTNYTDCLCAIEDLMVKGDASKILFYKRKRERQRVYKDMKDMNDSEIQLYAIILATPESCEACKLLDGKQYEIDQILEEFPLPVANCTHELGCRCTVSYEPKDSIIDQLLES